MSNNCTTNEDRIETAKNLVFSTKMILKYRTIQNIYSAHEMTVVAAYLLKDAEKPKESLQLFLEAKNLQIELTAAKERVATPRPKTWLETLYSHLWRT